MNMQVSSMGISAASIQGMDLETLLMLVQSNRAHMMELQLKDQVATVQRKNDQISALNSLMGQLNSALSKFSSTAKPTDNLIAIYPKNDGKGRVQDTGRPAIDEAFKGAGTDPLKMLPSGTIRDKEFDINEVTKTELDSAVTDLKSNIDSMSNTQQMDMLRLQSLSNKRNEAFDLMTNFMKKMQDNRSSVIGNMRG